MSKNKSRAAWVGYIMSPDCSQNKHGFKTKGDAKRAAKLARHKLIVKSIYKHSECGLFHMTSMSHNEYLKSKGMEL